MPETPDPVAALLTKTPTTPGQRADAWDAYHAATSADDLTTKLQALKIPDSVKADLWDLKATQAPRAPDFRTVVSGSSTTPAEVPRDARAVLGDQVIEAGKGALKGVGSTVYGLGKIVHDYTPIGRISDAIQPGAFDAPPPELEATNTAQRIGKGAEQIGEFFLPTAEAGALAKFANAPRFIKGAVEAAQAGGLTLAQTGSPATAGVSAGITAALPGVGAAMRGVSGALKSSAEKSVAQALGATKEWAKDAAGRLAPQMLERGIGGSRATMLERAAAKVKELGGQIGAEVEKAAQAGKTVDGETFVTSIANSARTMVMLDDTGKVLMIPGQEAAVTKLNDLANFVATVGPDIPIEKAQALKVAWDHIVSKAGLYGQKAMNTATDNARAWAFREGATAMRKLIAEEVPTIAALNQEYAFHKGLADVLTATEKRTQAQSGGLVAGITGATGAAAGFASGDSVGDRFQKALVGGVLGKQIVKVVQAPAFRTQVAGPLKDALANALAKGDQGAVLQALGKITAALPGRLVPAAAVP